MRTFIALVLSAILYMGDSRIGAAQTIMQVPSKAERQLIDALWAYQIEVVQSAAAGSKVDLRRFQEAVRFFESASGIIYEAASDVGKVPTPTIKKALKDWREWFKKNGDTLAYDSDHGGLVRKPG